MKTTLRRLLTLVLALAMVLSLLGTSALATDQESKQDKVSSSESGNAGEESGNAGEESGNADATPLMGNKISVNTAVFLTYNKKKAIKFQIKATASDGAKLSYTSNNKRVKVNANGKVSVPKGFKGKFVITVKAKATANYGSAQKKITFMVGPSAVSPASVKGGKKKITVKWKRNKAAKSYRIQVSKKKNFSKVTKTVKPKNKKAKKQTSVVKGLKKGTYYVRMRSESGSTYSAWSKVAKVQVKK